MFIFTHSYLGNLGNKKALVFLRAFLVVSAKRGSHRFDPVEVLGQERVFLRTCKGGAVALTALLHVMNKSSAALGSDHVTFTLVVIQTDFAGGAGLVGVGHRGLLLVLVTMISDSSAIFLNSLRLLSRR